MNELTLFEILKKEFSTLNFFNSSDILKKHQTFDFNHTTPTKKDIFYITYLKNKNGIRISNTINFHISINIVNNILSKFIEIDNDSEFITVKRMPNMEFESQSIFDLPKLNINENQTLLVAKNILLEYVTTKTLPFFEQIKTVEDVNEKIINAVSFEEYSNYIPGNTALKIIIIMHLCKNEKLNEYYKHLMNQIIDQSNDPEYKDYLYIIESQEKLINDLMIYLKGNI